MTSDRWQQVKDLFHEAFEMEGEERTIFLEELRSRDWSLYEELTSLLSADQESDDFMENPALAEYDPSHGMLGRQIGAYVLVRSLGNGGMGEVYLVERTDEFRQKAAMKILKQNMATDDFVDRFHLERQILADLDHPNIARLFDGGATEGGRPYLVMEYLEGKRMDVFCCDLGTEERLQLFLQVCEAVHYAHQNRVIHQDIKPANILITAAGQAKLLDFGIARESGGDVAAAEGAQPMTLRYASPEQIRGRPPVLASDIYALGVLLYELVAGCSPYEDSEIDAKVLEQAITGAPLRFTQGIDPIPRDLAVILEQCLAADSGDRFSSVKALSDELTLFMEGEPIQKRRGDFLYVLRRKARKNMRLVVLSCVALLILALVSGQAVRERRTTRVRIENARLFEQQAERVEANIRHVFMMPPHDLRPDMERLALGLERIRAMIDERGSLAIGPGYYALGRGYLAMGNYQEAKESLEKSWEEGFRGPDAAFALGRTYGALYQKALVEIESEQMRGREARKVQAGQLVQIRNEFMKPALRMLEKARPDQQGVTDYTLGLIHFYNQEYDQAREKALQARERLPWLFEAYSLEGDVFFRRGEEARRAGRYTEAVAAYTEACRSFEAASEIAPSSREPYLSRALAWFGILEARVYKGGGSIEEAFERCKETCERTLTVAPDSLEAYSVLSRLHRFMAANQADPGLYLEQSIEYARHLVALEPEYPRAYTELSGASRDLAEYLHRRGRPHVDLLLDAAAASQRSVELKPDYRSYNNLGMVYMNLANYDLETGRDPNNYWDSSILAYGRALEWAPGMVGAANNMANVLMEKARYRFGRGLDYAEDLDRAILELERASKVSPGNLFVRYNRVRAHNLRAVGRSRSGSEPTDDFLQALKDGNGLVQQRPKFHPFYNSLGSVFLKKAIHEWNTGGDYVSDLNSAGAMLENSLLWAPTYIFASRSLARVHLLEAETALYSGQSPTNGLTMANVMIKWSEAINIHDSDLPWLYGQSRLLAARNAVIRGQSAETEAKKGLAVLEPALCRERQSHQLDLTAGSLYTWLAQSRMDAESINWKKAWLALMDAYRFNPQNQDTTLALGEWILFHPQPPQAQMEQVLEIVDRICEQTPNHLVLSHVRDLIHAKNGQRKPVVASGERARHISEYYRKLLSGI